MRLVFLCLVLALVGCASNHPLSPGPPANASAIADGYLLDWADGTRASWQNIREAGQVVGFDFHLRTLESTALRWKITPSGAEAWRTEGDQRVEATAPAEIRKELDRWLEGLWAGKTIPGSGRACSLATLQTLLREVQRNCSDPRPYADIACAFSMAELQWCVSELQLAMEEAANP